MKNKLYDFSNIDNYEFLKTYKYGLDEPITEQTRENKNYLRNIIKLIEQKNSTKESPRLTNNSYIFFLNQNIREFYLNSNNSSNADLLNADSLNSIDSSFNSKIKEMNSKADNYLILESHTPFIGESKLLAIIENGKVKNEITLDNIAKLSHNTLSDGKIKKMYEEYIKKYTI